MAEKTKREPRPVTTNDIRGAQAAAARFAETTGRPMVLNRRLYDHMASNGFDMTNLLRSQLIPHG